MSNWIYSWKFGSRTAKALARALGAKRIRHTRSRFRGRLRKTVINYGCSYLPEEVLKCGLLNSPDSVLTCANKLLFFESLQDLPTLDWTTEWETAQQWDSIVCRTVLDGHSGRGIVITDPDNPVDAPLYTRYQKKDHEYRVHVVRGQVIDFARKARTMSVSSEDVNWQIRTHANGFIYKREGVSVPTEAQRACVECVRQLGLDFAAVDIITKGSDFWIVEVNTAPGMTGTTLTRYTEAFKQILGD